MPPLEDVIGVVALAALILATLHLPEIIFFLEIQP